MSPNRPTKPNKFWKDKVSTPVNKEDKLKAEASKFPNIIDFLNKPPEDLNEM